MSIGQIKSMHPGLSKDDFDYILWEQTSYPFGDARRVVKQFSAYLRAKANKRRLCECCSRDEALYHAPGCFFKGRG